MKLHGLCCLAMICGFPTPIVADELWVAVNHAPLSFRETVQAMDAEDKVRLPEDEWFDPRGADLWVLFVFSGRDDFTLSEIAQSVIRAIPVESASPLTRLNVDLENGRNLDVQVNQMSKTTKSSNFQGCLAALDVLSMAYERDYMVLEVIDEQCGKY